MSLNVTPSPIGAPPGWCLHRENDCTYLAHVETYPTSGRPMDCGHAEALYAMYRGGVCSLPSGLLEIARCPVCGAVVGETGAWSTRLHAALCGTCAERILGTKASA